MVHYYLLLAHWISLRYNTLSFWSTGYLYGPQLSSNCPLDISMVHIGLLDIAMVHFNLLLAHWISYGTLSSPIDPLVISTEHYYLLLTLWYTLQSYWSLAICMVHYYLLLAHSISLWYTTLLGPLAIHIVHSYLLQAHWIPLWYTTLSY